MQKVLIDTSVLLDLVLYYQVRHRRNRSVASSAAAAIESLIYYEHPMVEGPSASGVLNATNGSRFLGFYCDDSWETAVKQFKLLVEQCSILHVAPTDSESSYHSAVRTMAEILSPITEPDDLRAYELYDYLPYHLGEDPTALECQVVDASVADLDVIQMEDDCHNDLVRCAVEILNARNHPIRAAWALPLLRLFYYQALQLRSGCHFVPHATKSTLAFGRESETVSHRRLLEYCTDNYRAEYLALAKNRFSGLMIIVPVPPVAERVLLRSSDWSAAIRQVSLLRHDGGVVEYRRLLAQFLAILEEARSFDESRHNIETNYVKLGEVAQELARRWELSTPLRHVRVALPVADVIPGRSGPMNYLLLHDLFAPTGIAKARA